VKPRLPQPFFRPEHVKPASVLRSNALHVTEYRLCPDHSPETVPISLLEDVPAVTPGRTPEEAVRDEAFAAEKDDDVAAAAFPKGSRANHGVTADRKRRGHATAQDRKPEGRALDGFATSKRGART
jgi:hypothetical protein